MFVPPVFHSFNLVNTAREDFVVKIFFMKLKTRNHTTSKLLMTLLGALFLCAPTLAPARVALNFAPAEGEWTNGIVEKARAGSAPTTLRSVRAARNKDFDRVVFEFAGQEVSGYHVEYVKRPIENCGEGKVVRVAGGGFLRVRLTPAQAHTEQGTATIKDRERRMRLGVLREMELICDFEGQVEWVLGVASPNRFRVLELSNPARLVVDIKRKR
jgi:hypothetical protein